MRSTATLAAAAATMIAATTAVAGAPHAAAAAGEPAPCNYQAVSKGRVGALVCRDAKNVAFLPEFKMPITVASSAWLSHPYYEKGEMWGYGGYLAIDGKGRAAWIQGVEDTVEWAKPVKTDVRGLRVIVGAAATGNPDVKPTQSTFLYAVTTRGDLAQVPVTWSKGGFPSLGKQKVIAHGFGNYADMEFAWWQGKNWKPFTDNLMGLTKDGRLIEVAIKRGRTPKVTTRVLASTGMKNAVSLNVEAGGWGEKAVPWVVRSADGTTRRYLDPKYDDHSFKGAKATNLPKIPTSIALL